MNGIFNTDTPSQSKWGSDNDKLMQYGKWAVLALAALWVLKKLRIF